MQKIGKAVDDLPGTGQKLSRVPHDCDLPYGEQDGDEGHRAKPDEQFQMIGSHFSSVCEYGVAGQV